jgi:hypothetical protein
MEYFKKILHSSAYRGKPVYRPQTVRLRLAEMGIPAHVINKEEKQ